MPPTKKPGQPGRGQPKAKKPPEATPVPRDFIAELAATERDATEHSSINQPPYRDNDIFTMLGGLTITGDNPAGYENFHHDSINTCLSGFKLETVGTVHSYIFSNVSDDWLNAMQSAAADRKTAAETRFRETTEADRYATQKGFDRAKTEATTIKKDVTARKAVLSRVDAQQRSVSTPIFPVEMVDLGSVVGLAISCLQASGKGDLKSILPALDFYARFLRRDAIKIATTCVILDTESKFYWFGSTLYPDDYKDYCANRRRQILDTALLDSKTGVTLPVVPPLQQRSIGQYIRNHVVRGILHESEIVDSRSESVIGKSYTKLLNEITKERKPGVEETPGVKETWVGEQWQFKKGLELQTAYKTTEFVEAWNEIFGELSVPVTPTPALVFDGIEKRLSGKSMGQRYGHCAETYPLIFILGKRGQDLDSTKIQANTITRSKCQGLAKYVKAGRSCCTEFYTGKETGDESGIECRGSSNCMMKCARKDRCTEGCRGCPKEGPKVEGEVLWFCRGDTWCTTVCRQGANCKTRCGGHDAAQANDNRAKKKLEKAVADAAKAKADADATRDSADALAEATRDSADAERRICKTNSSGSSKITVCQGHRFRCNDCQDDDEKCKKEEKCWRTVCEPCMNSPASCKKCIEHRDDLWSNPKDEVGNDRLRNSEPCLQCSDYVPPCLNCYALIDKLKFGKYNMFLHRSQRVQTNDYLIWPEVEVQNPGAHDDEMPPLEGDSDED
ncbi:hypothetical protein Q9L58_009378 [Maublancomyces gigas]|uniref:Uncharacterized protein n=1 Tax=Discina gigas TaxID=1032678 RepID=A0ABR3G727_9PEZI